MHSREKHQDSYWVPTSRDEYPDMRLSRLPQVDYVVSKQSWVGRLLQRPNFELTQLMFFMNRLKQPGGQAFLSSDPAPLGANLLNWTERNIIRLHEPVTCSQTSLVCLAEREASFKAHLYSMRISEKIRSQALLRVITLLKKEILTV